MKNLGVIVLFLLVSQFVESQEYRPFDFDSGEWFCKYDTKGGMFGGNHGTYYAIDSVKFYCFGDTTINDATFKKLLYSGYTSSQIVERTYISGYYGAVRNDTLNKQVYFIPANYTSAYEGIGNLLYDFDLSVGDSIQISCLLDDKDTISLIDSVLYCDHYHRRYNTTLGYNIIEGLGSKNGLIPVNCLTNQGSLFCYQEVGNDLCNDCGFLTSIGSYSITRMNIFPNPTAGKIQIDSDLNIRYIELYDVDGSLLERINYDNGFIELRKNGCYIMKIYTDSEMFTRKLINNVAQ